MSWTGIRYSLGPANEDTDAAKETFSNDNEKGKAIDLIISMMKKGEGDIQPINQTQDMINGKNSKFYIILI